MGAPARIIVVSGAPQAVLTGTQLVAPLVAQVLDANGNGVSGQTVTFIPKGQGASVSFAGGVNTATTDVNGKATSAVMTANSIAGDFFVEAWLLQGNSIPGPGSIGPATFRLTSSNPGVYSNQAAIQTAWTTAKAKLATVQTDLAQLQTDLGAFEAACDTLYNLGASDVVDWLRTQARQSVLGWQPRVSTGGNTAPEIAAVWAPDTTKARDLRAVDQRPISSTTTGQFAQLN